MQGAATTQGNFNVEEDADDKWDNVDEDGGVETAEAEVVEGTHALRWKVIRKYRHYNFC